MKLGEVVNAVPTIGFNVKTISHNNMEFNCWDVGGGDKIYLLYRHYFSPDLNGLIWMVDSNDRDRLEDSKEKLFGNCLE